DFAIYAEGKHLQHLEHTIQLCVNNVQNWGTRERFQVFDFKDHLCPLPQTKNLHCARPLSGRPADPGEGGVRMWTNLKKAALNRALCAGKLICWSDLKPKTIAYIHSVWQKNWDAEGANKLNEVLPNLGEDLHRGGEGAGRKRETVMCRLRVGHTWLTQSYLLKN
ncbi:ribonuclease hi, partial [Plakobranchus ocellatus]